MPRSIYTMLDLAQRSGEGVHALIEGVLTCAPEMANLPVVPKGGITYTTLTRTGLPSGDFAKIGSGVSLGKSTWARDTGSMAKFEAQMRVNDDILTVAQSENSELITEDFLSDEAIATLQGSAIRLGAQAWYGKKISQDGFAGLSTLVNTDLYEINAGAAANVDSSSVYLVRLADNTTNPQDVHLVAGAGGKMSFSDVWTKQYTSDPEDVEKQMAVYCNHFLSFLGLVCPRAESVYRVKNVTRANPFTDATAADIWSRVPLKLRDTSKFAWFMNGTPLYTLQASRATVNVATDGKKGVGTGGVFPDVPTSCQGIRIIPTDSLSTKERNGLLPA